MAKYNQLTHLALKGLSQQFTGKRAEVLAVTADDGDVLHTQRSAALKTL